jgi:hypothetical protein
MQINATIFSHMGSGHNGGKPCNNRAHDAIAVALANQALR